MEDQLTITQKECTRLLLENRELKSRLGLAGAVADVRSFHEKFGVPILREPTIPSEGRVKLRADLIHEESAECTWAIETCNLIEIADGIADTIYVCVGAALEFGIPIVDVWEEVQRTNMLKVGGARRVDGKILKPEGWEPPRIGAILERAAKS